MRETGEMKVSDLKSFHYLENGQIDFSIMPTIKSTHELDPKVYNLKCFNGNDGVKYILSVLQSQENVELIDFANRKKLDDLMDAFFNKEVIKVMTELGFMHKTGILLYGIEGTGKSTIIKHYCNRLIPEQKAIIICFNSGHYFEESWQFVSRIRQVQKNPIVVVLDEFDRFFEDGQESDVKSALDGPLAIDNCIVLATTNYINRIPDSVQRPSRFKYVIRVDAIEDKALIHALVGSALKGKASDEEITVIASSLTGKTLDEIKHACLDKIMQLTPLVPSKPVIGFKSKL